MNCGLIEGARHSEANLPRELSEHTKPKLICQPAAKATRRQTKGIHRNRSAR